MTQQTVYNKGLKLSILSSLMSFFNNPDNPDYAAPAGRQKWGGHHVCERVGKSRELVKSRRRMRRASQRRNRL